MPYVLKHRSFPSHHEHAHTPQTHINAHAHTQTTMHTEEHILNHSQAQSHVHSHKEYTHIDIHIIICTEKTQVEHTHTHTDTGTPHTQTQAHSVVCFQSSGLSCLSSRPPPNPCTLRSARSSSGSMWPVQTNREQVCDTVAGQHYSGPGPWHPAPLDQLLSGCQAAERAGPTRSAAPAQQPGGRVGRRGATWNPDVWSPAASWVPED